MENLEKILQQITIKIDEVIEIIEYNFSLKEYNELSDTSSIYLLTEDTIETRMKRALYLLTEITEKLEEIKKTYKKGKSYHLKNENEVYNEVVYLLKRIDRFNKTISNINYIPTEGSSWQKIYSDNNSLFDLLKMLNKEPIVRSNSVRPFWSKIVSKAKEVEIDTLAIYEVFSYLFKK